MAVTITLEQAQEYLNEQGINLPDSFVTALITITSKADDCLDAHYTDDEQLIIRLTLLGILGSVQQTKYISSQTAPSGASQSFRLSSLLDSYRGLKSLLSILDPYGCTSGLVPAEPGASAGLWVSTGGKCC